MDILHHLRVRGSLSTRHRRLLLLSSGQSACTESCVCPWHRLLRLRAREVEPFLAILKALREHGESAPADIAEKYGLPIHAIGVGEGMGDLRPFDANEVARIIAGVEGVRK